MRASYRSARGFSLVELAVALGIVGIIAVVTLPQIRTSNQLAEDSEVKASLNAVLSTVSGNYGLSGSIAPLVACPDDPASMCPPPADITATAIRSKAPDVLVSADGATASTWYREVSVDQRWVSEGQHWRVGAASLGVAKGGDTAAAACWLAFRDIDPESGFAEQNSGRGVTLEKYFLVESGFAPADCTGEAATYASAEGVDTQDLAAGATWNNPLILPAIPVVGP